MTAVVKRYDGIPITWTGFKQLVAAAENTYPWSVHIAHDLISVADYRTWRGSSTSWLHAYLASFHYGNGGTPVTDLVHTHVHMGDGTCNYNHAVQNMCGSVASFVLATPVSAFVLLTGAFRLHFR